MKKNFVNYQRYVEEYDSVPTYMAPDDDTNKNNWTPLKLDIDISCMLFHLLPYSVLPYLINSFLSAQYCWPVWTHFLPFDWCYGPSNGRNIQHSGQWAVLFWLSTQRMWRGRHVPKNETHLQICKILLKISLSWWNDSWMSLCYTFLKCR